MTDKVKHPFPRPIDIPIRFMDRFTVKDLARLGIPTLLGTILTTLTNTPVSIGATIGAVTGTVLVLVKIRGEKLDVHLRNAAPYLLGTHNSSWPQIEEVVDGVATLSDGTAVGIVQVSPCELDMLSKKEQKANIGVVHNLYKTLDHPIEIHSRQQRTDLSHLEGCQDTAVTTEHLITVKTDGETAVETVSKRCRKIRNQLIGADLYAEQLTGEKLENTVKQHHFDDVNLSTKTYTVNQEHRHRRLLAVTEYPSEATAGWLADILKVDGTVDTIQAVEPVTEDQRDWLSRTASRLTAELSNTRNPRNQTELRRAKQDAEDMLDAETQDERLVNYAVYITVKAQTQEELENTLDKVKTRLRSHRIKFKEPFLQTHRAVKTDSLYTPDHLQQKQIVPGRSAATSFSFNTSDNIDQDGILVGKENRSGQPLVLNRFSWEAPHTARMGKTGSGKTFHKTLEILRQLQQNKDLQIHIIDPKPDYQNLVEAVDGETQVIDDQLEKPGAQVTRYIASNPEGENSELLAKTIRHIYQTASQYDGETIVVVDEAHRVLKHPRGRNALEDLIREGRSKQIGVDIITQNASDLTNNAEGRNILKNVDCLLFFKHQELDTGVTQFFQLTANEAENIHKLKTGTDLPFSQALIRGPVNTQIRIEATQQEHKTIQSGEQEVEKNEPSESENEEESAHGREIEPEYTVESADIEEQEKASEEASKEEEKLPEVESEEEGGDQPDSGLEEEYITLTIGGVMTVGTGLVYFNLINVVNLQPLPVELFALLSQVIAFIVGFVIVFETVGEVISS